MKPLFAWRAAWALRSYGLLLALFGCSARDSEAVGALTTESGAGHEPAETSGVFLGAPDGGSASMPCDLLDDDCPLGLKCAAYASDGGETPDAARCVPLASPARQVDEDCTVQGWVASGLDDCDRGLTCWGVDPLTLRGQCVPLCEGPSPVCADRNRRCRHAGGPLRICLLACNPLADDACGEGRGCYPYNDWLACLTDVSGQHGAAGEPCVFINGCAPGLYCAAAADVPGCEESDCCAHFCALSRNAAQCDASDQACVSFFSDGTAPDGLEDLGRCARSP